MNKLNWQDWQEIQPKLEEYGFVGCAYGNFTDRIEIYKLKRENYKRIEDYFGILFLRDLPHIKNIFRYKAILVSPAYLGKIEKGEDGIKAWCERTVYSMHPFPKDKVTIEEIKNMTYLIDQNSEKFFSIIPKIKEGL